VGPWLNKLPENFSNPVQEALVPTYRLRVERVTYYEVEAATVREALEKAEEGDDDPGCRDENSIPLRGRPDDQN
jgi:hypothetical protein